jgi:hypothetical protein
MIMKGLKSVHCADAFGPSVILVFGYLTHRKMCEIVIYEFNIHGSVHRSMTQ